MVRTPRDRRSSERHRWRESAAKLHDIVRPNGGARRRSSQWDDLQIWAAGVWEAAARQLPRVEQASMRAPNARVDEVSADHNAILGSVPALPPVRAGEWVLGARDAGLPRRLGGRSPK